MINLKKIHPKTFYQPVLRKHPKIERFEYRIKTIMDYCGNGKYLDVGSNVGYNSFELAKEGNTVIGIESNKIPYDVSQVLNTNVKFLNIRIEDYEPEEFDTALFLIIFHHMLKEDKDKAFETLNRIAENSKLIVMQTRFRNWLPVKSEEEIQDFVIKNSILNKYKQIGDSSKMPFGIPVYVFEK